MVEPVETVAVAGVISYENLKDALGLGERELTAIVGGGGKSTFMYMLTEELHRSGFSVAAATTTRIFAPHPTDPVALFCGENTGALRGALDGWKVKPLVLGGSLLENNKVAGIEPGQCDELFNSGAISHLVVEADGARRKPLKAPGEHEPVVPISTTVFLAVVGLSCLGRRLDEDIAFRPERVALAGKINTTDTITVNSLVNLLSADNGLRKGCPPRARRVVLLNQADTQTHVDAARQIAEKLLSADTGWERVMIGHLKCQGSQEPIEEIWIR